MKNRPAARWLAVVAVLIVGEMIALRAEADPPGLRAEHGWIRAAPPGAAMLAGYAVLRNESEQPIRIVAAAGTDFGAVEIHRSEVVEGLSRMRRVAVLEIPAGGQTVLEPNGLHLMLMMPRRMLVIGHRSSLVLTDDKGNTYSLTLTVAANPRAAGD